MTLKEAQEVLDGWTIKLGMALQNGNVTTNQHHHIIKIDKMVSDLLEAARVVEREKIRNSIDFYLKKEQENSFFSSTDNLEKLKQEILSDNQEGK